ncbi:MAG: hypothetical protein Q9163_000678 [Psora crenata]
MPIAQVDLVEASNQPGGPTELPFPTLTRSHILNCSYHSWYPRYRSLTPKARLVALSVPFLTYLRADGIVLPPEPSEARQRADPLTPPPSDPGSDVWDDEDPDPSEAWSDVHVKVQETIRELGGSVMPKLNWSAPKDATWISATNTMECRNANDIYLLLKSSDFVTHDLEQVWDDVEEEEQDEENECDTGDESDRDEQKSSEQKAEEVLKGVPYHLVLRKTIPAYNPALEFRCFVRARHLLCICQRDLNYFSFLPALVPKLRTVIEDFYQKNLQRSFLDENFAFDVYIPPPHDRVWLIDINPWAIRTDPLLFSWLEILTMPAPEQIVATALQASMEGDRHQTEQEENGCNGFEASESEDEKIIYTPEFRLVNRDDPEAYAFNTPKYSAHKLPRDVVDAGNDGEAGLREFMGAWREIVRQQESEQKSSGLGKYS